MKPDYWRQMDFYNPMLDNANVLVAGAGATGSYVAFALARMGKLRFDVVDFDTVEQHNLPNQFFSEALAYASAVPKITALKNTIDMLLENTNIIYHCCRVEELDLKRYDIIIVAVDCMEVRKKIFDMSNPICHIIDPRTGGEYYNMFYCNKDDKDNVEYYKASLFSNEDASPLRCTGRAVIDVSMGVTAQVIALYRKIIQNKPIQSYQMFYDNSTGMGSPMHTIGGNNDEDTD